MRDLRKKVLLGVDINKEIVFGEMDIQNLVQVSIRLDHLTEII